MIFSSINSSERENFLKGHFPLEILNKTIFIVIRYTYNYAHIVLR